MEIFLNYKFGWVQLGMPFPNWESYFICFLKERTVVWGLTRLRYEWIFPGKKWKGVNGWSRLTSNIPDILNGVSLNIGYFKL